MLGYWKRDFGVASLEVEGIGGQCFGKGENEIGEKLEHNKTAATIADVMQLSIICGGRGYMAKTMAL